jgi:hypothetical protein
LITSFNTDFFEVNRPSYYELYVKEITSQEKLFFCIKVSTTDNITYFQISQQKIDEVTKVIHNKTPFKLEIKSKSIRTEPVQEIEAGDKIHYSQNYPNRAGSVIYINFENHSKMPITIEVDFLKITAVPRHFDCGDPEKMIQVSVRFIGHHKVIEVVLVGAEELRQLNQEKQDNVITFKFAYNIIDISFMSLERKQPRREICNLFLFDTAGLIEVKNMTNITLKGFIHHFQIDNNSNMTTSFPVMVRRTDEKFRKNIEKKKFVEWNVAFENPSMSSHLYVSNLCLSLGNLEVFLEEEYLDQLISYASRISERIQEENTETNFDFIKRKYFEKIDLPDNFDFNRKVWEFAKLDKNNNYVYIDNMSLPKLKCLLSYYQDASSTMEKDFALVSLIGVAVGGFENASIEIKGWHKE